MADKKRSAAAEYVRMVLVLLLICAVTSGVVAGVNALTKEKIAENLEMQIKSSISEMFGEGIEYTTLTEIPAGVEEVYEIVRGGETMYCANINSSGFGGDVNMLVGLAKDGKIIGVSVVSHSETPGLGSVAAESGFLGQFVGVNNPDRVDSIAGATISSEAVKAGIAEAQRILDEAGIIDYEKQEVKGQ